MLAPPDPESDKAPLWQGGAPIAKSDKQKQRYSISVETQAAFCILLPTFLTVVLLAIAGARQ
jgi:hypothetical protein